MDVARAKLFRAGWAVLLAVLAGVLLFVYLLDVSDHSRPSRREVDAVAFELIEVRQGPYAVDPNPNALRRTRRTSLRYRGTAHQRREEHVRRYLVWRARIDDTRELWDSVMVWRGNIPPP